MLNCSRSCLCKEMFTVKILQQYKVSACIGDDCLLKHCNIIFMIKPVYVEVNISRLMLWEKFGNFADASTISKIIQIQLDWCTFTISYIIDYFSKKSPCKEALDNTHGRLLLLRNSFLVNKRFLLLKFGQNPQICSDSP